MNPLFANATSGPAVALGLIGLFSIFLAAWVNTVDIALSRMSLAYAEDLQEEGRRGADHLLKAVAYRKRSANNLLAARAFFQTIGFVSLTVLVSSLFASVGWPWWGVLLGSLAGVGLVQLIAVTISLRLLSGSRYVGVALFGAPLASRLLSFSGFFFPFSESLRTRLAKRSKQETERRLVVADDLREMIDEVSEGRGADVLEDEDRKILQSVFELGLTRVGELMVPRNEMVTIRSQESLEAALEVFVRSGFSRIPVVGKNLDDIQGVLYLKDVIRREIEPHVGKEPTAKDLARPAAFVPEMKLADDELRVMQATNNHLALVVDEYGGIAGLLTIEDILEELVGELIDEHDKYAAVPEEVAPGVWRVPTSFPIDDLAELLDMRIEEDEVYSAGGLLTKALGKVLIPGSRAIVGGVDLEADSSVGRRRRVVSVFAKRVNLAVNDGDAPPSDSLNDEKPQPHPHDGDSKSSSHDGDDPQAPSTNEAAL